MISFLQQHNKFMDRQWLQAQFKLHPNKKKADLAQLLGLEAPAISKILAGTRDIKAREYIEMRSFFGLPNDGAKSLERRGHTIQSYVSQNQNLQDRYHVQENSWIIPSQHLPDRIEKNSDNLRIFKIEDDAMTPDFKKGTFVLLDTSQKMPSPPGVFLISDGVGEIVRRCALAAQSNPPQLKISPSNTDYESEIISFKENIILGRVVAKLEWI